MGQCKSALKNLHIDFRKAKLKKSFREHGTKALRKLKREL
jgi:hypothetical protein